jgi:uncharacterized protein (DUF2249 family)
MSDHELDVRPIRKPDKHPVIFRAYKELPAGESLLLVNDHDPRHLHDEFEVEHPGGYTWEYIAKDRGDWRIRITKLAATSLPRILTGAHAGPDVDVLIHVLAGSGQLITELSTLRLHAGTLIWLPRHSQRQFTAGPDGLRYLTVHQRRQALTLTTASVGR